MPARLAATLPGAAARYTLRVSSSRAVPHAALSTQVSATWSFRSARTTARSALPLMTARYQIPGLNGQNQAAAGTTMRVPVWVTREPGATAARVTGLTVQVSFDDGRNWHRIPLTRVAGHWLATIHNPAESGYASLRATAADSAHDTVTQTIIRAYAVVAALPHS